MSHLLAEFTTLRLGGPARRVVTAGSTAELVDAVRTADAQGERLLVIGGGSNLVVGDDGWDGVVVLVRNTDVVVRTDSERAQITVDAGVTWDDLVADTVAQEFSGLAAMSGIPGSTGGTPVQNVGAYGIEVADVISEVRVLDRHTGELEDWPAARCAFAFRSSAFKHTDRYVVLTVTLTLPQSPDAPPIRYAELARRLGVEIGEAAPSKDVREAVLALRASKGMVLDEPDPDTWSVGSFFVNPFVEPDLVPEGCPHWATDEGIKLSAAWLIEHAGFGKGFGLDRGDGRVALSTKHTLALTNRGGATTAELLELAANIRDGVERRFGIRLRPEAHLVGVQF
ncbi:UDP-N-acetylmuramate dehydrogenase [uncultured Jatrophihabitans sp.]|uniref:UDP-N-acetylmuramate dehydrogenase n=1 Tax=uncultured Jatrophihabitans sp. TaxID=1610747 RepID=UPI0035CA63A1